MTDDDFGPRQGRNSASRHPDRVAVVAQRAVLADASLLRDLDRRIFPPGWRLQTWQAQLRDERARAWWIDDRSASSGTEQLAPAPLGFALVTALESQAELLKIGILETSRSLGHATQMLRQILAELRRDAVQEVFLELRCTNLPARRLYNAHGFECIGRRSGYYSDGEDAVMLRLDLQAATDSTSVNEQASTDGS